MRERTDEQRTTPRSARTRSPQSNPAACRPPTSPRVGPTPSATPAPAQPRVGPEQRRTVGPDQSATATDPAAADPALTGRDPPPARPHPARRRPRHRPRPALVAVPPAPPNPSPDQPLPPPRRPPTSGTANVVPGTPPGTPPCGFGDLGNRPRFAQGRWRRPCPGRLSTQRPMHLDVRVADVHTRAEPARRGRLKRIQYRPELLDGFLGQTRPPASSAVISANPGLSTSVVPSTSRPDSETMGA